MRLLLFDWLDGHLVGIEEQADLVFYVFGVLSRIDVNNSIG